MFISSPNYPKEYNNSEDKDWPIQAPAGQHITFEFTDFSIEPHSSCQYDWVQVVDANALQFLNKSCGDTAPKRFLVTSNEAIVKFHSDRSVTKKGFRLKYIFQKPPGLAGNRPSKT